MPEINSVYLRQDNTGWYHCASTLLLVHRVATKHGMNLKRVDFSDPQSGKGACDRKATTLKTHMRIYVNAGHDIETASQMMTAIESSGETAGVSVTLSGPQPTEKSAPVKWRESVSLTRLNTVAMVCNCGERMELVAVNFYPGVIFAKQAVAFCLI